MERFIKQRERIERELDYYKNILRDLNVNEQESMEKLKNKREDLNLEISLFTEYKEILKSKKAIFVSLKSEVRKYKEKKLKDVELKYIEKYNNYVTSVNQLTFNTNYNIFLEFDKVVEIYKRLEFPNLKNKLHDFIVNKKQSLFLWISEKIRGKIGEKNRTHEVLFYIKFLTKYEIYFDEYTFTDVMFEYLSMKFEYHFLSNKDTNRLDKPEWFLEYLYSKFCELKKFIKIYCDIKNDEHRERKVNIFWENQNENRNVDEIKTSTTEGTMEVLIYKSKSLINIKINELLNLESTQKRNLILNFGYVLCVFIEKLRNDFEVRIEFDNFSKVLEQVEKDYVTRKLDDIHEKKYMMWFNLYEDLTREVLVFEWKYREINKYFSISYLIKRIIEYNTIFIDSMRYIKREEIVALCNIYTRFESFKELICDIENEIISERVPKDGGSCRQSNCMIEEDKGLIDSLDNISKFNIENYKLIRNLLENDINNLLRVCVVSKYNSGSIYRNFIIELNKILDDYKDCKNYKRQRLMVADNIDKYFLENIILVTRFERLDFLEFTDFFSKVKDIFNEINEWKTDEGIKIIKNIFGGTKEDKSNPLYNMIYQIYKDEQ